jgi:hypothetical protein
MLIVHNKHAGFCLGFRHVPSWMLELRAELQPIIEGDMFFESRLYLLFAKQRVKEKAAPSWHFTDARAETAESVV